VINRICFSTTEEVSVRLHVYPGEAPLKGDADALIPQLADLVLATSRWPQLFDHPTPSELAKTLVAKLAGQFRLGQQESPRDGDATPGNDIVARLFRESVNP
jgi:hypothetical protein